MHILFVLKALREARENLPPEPLSRDDTIDVRVRGPDGQFVRRTFLVTHTSQVILSGIHTQPWHTLSKSRGLSPNYQLPIAKESSSCQILEFKSHIRFLIHIYLRSFWTWYTDVQKKKIMYNTRTFYMMQRLKIQLTD